MIVISMLLVILAFVSLLLGVLDVTVGDIEPLMFVYGSIGLCLVAGLFLAIGVLRSRPSQKPLVTADRQGASWSGAAGRQGGVRPVARDAPAEPAPEPAERPPAEAAPEPAERPPAEPATEPAERPPAEPAERQTPAQVAEPPPPPEPEPAEGRLQRPTPVPPPEPAPPPRPRAAGEPPARPAAGAGPRTTGPPRAPAPEPQAPRLTPAEVAQRLEAVNGVGPARQQALVEHFGSHEALARASVNELAAVRGVSETLARRIYDGLRH